MTTAYIEIVEWKKFQHYKDRDPPWIKLHRILLDNYQWSRLQDASKAHLVGLWLLAGRFSNRIPADPAWIAKKIEATSPVDLQGLVAAGFIEIHGEMVQDASKPLAERSPEERRVETELHPPPPQREAVPEKQPEEPSRPPSRHGEPELGRLLAMIPESAGVEVDETIGDFFAEMGPDHPRYAAVIGYVRMWGNGMGVPPPPLRPTWPDIAAGLATYHGEVPPERRDYGEAHVRSFVMKFANERANPKPARNGAGGGNRRPSLMERNIANAIAAASLPPLPGDG